MPRHMNEEEKVRAFLTWGRIKSRIKNPCDLVYTPDLIRFLVQNDGMSKEDALQAIRDWLALGQIEMHFDQNLKPVSRVDAPFVFPPPAWTNDKHVSPYPLSYLRMLQQPGKDPCDLEGRGAGAPDFDQPPLIRSGSYVVMGPDAKTERTIHFRVPPLDVYDLIIVSTSAGKDSQACLDAVFRECRRLGLEDRLFAYHADLGDIEWPGAPALAEVQARYYGVSFDKVQKTEKVYEKDEAGKKRLVSATPVTLLDMVEKKGEWPGIQNWQRYCTAGLKRDPIKTLFTRDVDILQQSLADAGLEKKQIRILLCMGIRADESTGRRKKGAFTPNNTDQGLNNKRAVDVWFPIFHWTAKEVWETIARSGVPHHYAYDVGDPRLSCIFCVAGDWNACLLGGIYNPEVLDKHVDMEKKLLAMPQSVARQEKGKGKRISQFVAKFSLTDVREAILRGEKPAEHIDINT